MGAFSEMAKNSFPPPRLPHYLLHPPSHLFSLLWLHKARIKKTCFCFLTFLIPDSVWFGTLIHLVSEKQPESLLGQGSIQTGIALWGAAQPLGYVSLLGPPSAWYYPEKQFLSLLLTLLRDSNSGNKCPEGGDKCYPLIWDCPFSSCYGFSINYTVQAMTWASF